MEWWYKSDRYKVSATNTRNLEDALMTFLRQGNKPTVATLYDDQKFFYIKTTNSTFLQPFIFEHGFDELEKKPVAELNLLFGVE